MISKQWRNEAGEVVVNLQIDDASISLTVYEEVESRYHKDIVELQSLDMYPPIDEDLVEGTRTDDGGVKYCFKKGKNWERAKEEIVKTFDFWLGQNIQLASIL